MQVPFGTYAQRLQNQPHENQHKMKSHYITVYQKLNRPSVRLYFYCMGGTSLKNSANGHERCFWSRQTKNRLCALAYYDIVVTYWAANGRYLTPQYLSYACPCPPGFAQLVPHGLDIIVVLCHYPAEVLEDLNLFKGLPVHRKLTTKGQC
jgi:hypothetical protein